MTRTQFQSLQVTIMSESEQRPAGLRFSLRTLLIGMAAIALLIPLGGYALRNASTWVGPLVVLITSLLLAGMLCMACNRQGASRAYWTGCAIFGLTYFIIAGDPWSQPYNYELFTETIAMAAYNELYPEGETTQVQPDAPEPIPIPDGAEKLEVTAAANPGPAPPDPRDFVMVAHMFWSLLFAFVGGWVSLAMYWTGQRQAEGGRSAPSV
jgi:hypothetical protein